MLVLVLGVVLIVVVAGALILEIRVRTAAGVRLRVPVVPTTAAGSGGRHRSQKWRRRRAGATGTAPTTSVPTEVTALLAGGAGALVLQQDWLQTGLGAVHKVTQAADGIKGLAKIREHFAVPDLVDLEALDADMFDVMALDPDIVDLDFSADDALGLGQVLGPALAVYREVKIVSSGGASLGQGARNAGLVAGGSVAGRATGAGIGFAIDVMTGGMTLGLGTVLGGKIGAFLGKSAGEHARLAPLRQAQSDCRASAEACEAAVAEALRSANQEFALEVGRQAAVIGGLERRHRAQLEKHLDRAQKGLAAEVQPQRVWPIILELHQDLQTMCQQLDPAVCAPTPMWSRWLVRRELSRRLAGWLQALHELVHVDLTDQRHRTRVAEALCMTPGGATVAGKWLTRLDNMERKHLADVARIADEAQAELELADQRATDVARQRREALEAEAQRTLEPATAALRAAAERVRQQGRALGYCPA